MKLTRYEDAVFSFLKTHVGTSVTRMELEEELIEARSFDGPALSKKSNVLEVLISRIRKKLPLGHTIASVRGVGYKLTVVALCDSCHTNPGTHHVLVGFEKLHTFVCDNCSPFKAPKQNEQLNQ